MKEWRYYVLAPVNTISGGPELAHQMCRELLLMGEQAWMFYIYNGIEAIDFPANERFQKYGTSHIKNIEQVEKTDSILIVPEGMAEWALCYHKCKIVLWWMSVDGYLKRVRLVGKDFFDVLDERVSLHLVQSQYAYQYLLKRGIAPEKILWVSDYIGEDYGKVCFPADLRQDIVLYNPKKGLEEVEPLIQKINWLKWMPLSGLTEAQMIAAMNIAKIYIDLGDHPGKDRIPREAASCGCCVITNRKGSAAFFEDVPIPDRYKIDDVQMEYDRIERLLKDICLHWEEHNRQFDIYRKMIMSERKKFSEDVRRFVDVAEFT